MRKIAATYVFPINKVPVKNGILICDEDGTIIDLIEKGETLTEEQGLEYYSGIIVPGFVNAHCHLELSHLKDKIEAKKGIGAFIGAINKLRNEEGKSIEKALKIADRKMWASGISAVGDISNSSISLNTKIQSNIYYHTFVETFGFHPARADKSFDYACKIYSEFTEAKQPVSIVPHSPYSVSEPLFKKIRQKALTDNSLMSIHNQESMGETQFYLDGTGPISDHLRDNLGIDTSHWQPTGKSSLQSILKYLPPQLQLLLIHNTYFEENDLIELKKQRSLDKTHFVLCPNSNLYIEDALPPVRYLMTGNLNICLGTDSLASNNNLSVLSEMITLQNKFPELELELLLKWATLNGAKALGIDSNFGSFEPGKKPGINLISGIDFQQMKFTHSTTVKRLQ